MLAPASIEHSENKIITQSGLSGEKIGPGVLHSRVQQTSVLQEYQRHKQCATNYVSLFLFCELFADCTGIANNDLAWFESYLSNRIQYCSIDGHDSEPKTNIAGIPQGSSLGPILFLMYINDLTCTVEHSEINLFADDTNLTCTDKMLREAQQKINDDLAVLGEWLAANKLSANLIKTENMTLAAAPKLNKMNFSPLIKLNGKPIKRVSTSDYLGLIIDEKLSWQQYISSLKRKNFLRSYGFKAGSFPPRKI